MATTPVHKSEQLQEEICYVVRFWIDPVDGGRVLDWLNDAHLADVAAQPGFLWARLIELEENDEWGWPAYVMIYGIQSREALESYLTGDAPLRYARERSELGIDPVLRAERSSGRVVRHLA
jgi:hypothetical protein